MKVNKELWEKTKNLISSQGHTTPYILDVRESCASTMDLAKDYLKNKGEENSVFISLIQTSGKGRQDRVWESDLGGLYMTVALKTPISYDSTYGLSLAVGTSVLKTLNQYQVNGTLKWPNDVLDLKSFKKMSGILIESIPYNSSSSGMCLISVGVGLNINQDTSGNEKIISMREYLERESGGATCINFEEVSLNLANRIVNDYEIFHKEGFLKFREFWTENTYMKDKEISYFNSGDNNKVLKGEFLEISEKGNLILKDINNNIIELNSGEVSIKIDRES